MEVKRILWPTDFSENASRALPMVTSLSQAYGAEIHILYVMKDYPEFGAHYGDFDPQEKETMPKNAKLINRTVVVIRFIHSPLSCSLAGLKQMCTN